MKKCFISIGTFVFLLFSGCSFGSQSTPVNEEKKIDITPPPSLESIIQDLNITTDAQKLSESTKSVETAIRALSAQNKNTPQEDLWALANDSQLAVRSYLATNPALPEELFEKLSKDIAEDVRIKIAGNPGTPPRILKTLYEDTSAVQNKIAMNKGLSDEMLEELAQKLTATNALEALAGRYKLPESAKIALKKRNIDSVNAILNQKKESQ